MIKSFAKVNLFLKVTGKLKKYHKLYSLITHINLYDEIFIKETKNKSSKIEFSGPFKIHEKNNTIINIINLFKKKFPKTNKKNFIIHIKKNIPNGSGLGGASSNATTIFNYLKNKFKLKISKKKSIKLLGKVGKDCPVFINKYIKVIKSSGEKYDEFKKKLSLNILVVYPNYKLSTRKVFKNFKKISNINTKKKLSISQNYDLIKISKLYGNDLLPVALKMSSKIRSLKKLINKINDGNYYSMTGSGSAFFIISHHKKSLLNIQKIIKKQKNSFWTKLTKTI